MIFTSLFVAPILSLLPAIVFFGDGVKNGDQFKKLDGKTVTVDVTKNEPYSTLSVVYDEGNGMKSTRGQGSAMDDDPLACKKAPRKTCRKKGNDGIYKYGETFRIRNGRLQQKSGTKWRDLPKI